MSTLKTSRVPTAQLAESVETSLLDIVDNVLTKGVVLRGDVVIGVAGIDLIYLQLTAVLCAADKVLPREK